MIILSTATLIAAGCSSTQPQQTVEPTRTPMPTYASTYQPQGLRGSEGERGPTMTGPTGPAGRAGATGERGPVGPTGGAGSTTAGVVGAVGAEGPMGSRGAVGMRGEAGQAGVIEHWTTYREFWFDPKLSAIHNADRHLLAEIAAFIKANPSLEIEIGRAHV